MKQGKYSEGIKYISSSLGKNQSDAILQLKWAIFKII
jgi:hypothetical protein